MDQYNEFLEQYALNNENYKQWRRIHAKQFGKLFTSAFSKNKEAQIHLTAALINISQRQFAQAMPKLDLLESICVKDFDMAAVCYFKGLNFEYSENEQEMCEYYEKFREFNVSLVVWYPFNPYYRTAKFAQRASECTKAIHYYQKSLQFYDGIAPNPKQASTVSQILYDIATVYLYEHNYGECERFLSLSKEYDPSVNVQRDYITAIWHAIHGRLSECDELIQSMNAFFKENCQAQISAILDGRDLHYCVVEQNRSSYGEFWRSFSSREAEITALVDGENVDGAQEIISEMLTNTLVFMKRKIDCRIEKIDDRVTVYCKNYNVKTLISEYEALFGKKPSDFENWNFVSVNEFKDFGA